MELKNKNKFIMFDTDIHLKIFTKILVLSIPLRFHLYQGKKVFTFICTHLTVLAPFSMSFSVTSYCILFMQKCTY